MGLPLLAVHVVWAAKPSRDSGVFVWGAVLPGVAARAHNAALAPGALQGAQLAPAQLEGASQAVCCNTGHMTSPARWSSQRAPQQKAPVEPPHLSPELVGLLLRIAEALLQEAAAALLSFQQADKLSFALDDIQCDCRLACTGSQEPGTLNPKL